MKRRIVLIEAQLLYDKINVTDSLIHNVKFSFVDYSSVVSESLRFYHIEFDKEVIHYGYRNEKAADLWTWWSC